MPYKLYSRIKVLCFYVEIKGFLIRATLTADIDAAHQEMTKNL